MTYNQGIKSLILLLDELELSSEEAGYEYLNININYSEETKFIVREALKNYISN